MDKEKKLWQMDLLMTVISKKAKRTEQVSLLEPTEVDIKANGETTSFTEEVSSSGLMATNMKDSGKKVKCTAQANSIGQTEESTMANTRTTSNTDTASTLTWTSDNIKASGTTENNKEKVSTFFKTDKYTKVYGKMEL